MNPARRISLRNSAIAMALAVLFIAGFFPTLLALHYRWSAWTESYSHGYLLLAVALFLYFDSKQPAPRWLPDVRRWAAWPLAALSLAWLICYLGGVGILQQLMVVLIAAALLASLLDRDRWWRALLSLGLVMLAIPIWDELLARPLQIAATTVSGWAVSHLFGMPTRIDGFHISIPAGTFEVASGCAGLVFLLSAVALGIVYGQFFLKHRISRSLAIFVAAILGILINWIRIISLILIGQYSNMQSTLISDGHLLYGWYLFSGAFALILLISHFVIKAHPEVSAPADDAILQWSWPRLTTVATALACGPLLLLLFRMNNHSVAPEPPATIAPYLRQVSPNLTGFVEPAINSSFIYTLEPDLTASFIYYPTPFGKGKLISQSNRLFAPNDKVIDEIVLETSASLPARRQLRIKIAPAGTSSQDINTSTLLVWDWYEIGNTYAATAAEGKWQQLKQTLHGSFDGFYIRLALPCREESCSVEQHILARHAPAIYRDLRPELERIRTP